MGGVVDASLRVKPAVGIHSGPAAVDVPFRAPTTQSATSLHAKPSVKRGAVDASLQVNPAAGIHSGPAAVGVPFRAPTTLSVTSAHSRVRLPPRILRMRRLFSALLSSSWRNGFLLNSIK